MEIKIEAEKLRERSIFLAVPMYGGSCTGTFARSVADLTALCTHYGVQIRLYFLFNESLITRGRNYCADEFMRSGDSHLLFIDADIGFNARDVIAMLALQSQNPEDDQYDILCAPYPKKCLHSSTKIITEDGVKTIHNIVSKGYTGKVLSLSPSNQLEWKNITKHWSEPNHVGKQWVSLQTQYMAEGNKISPRGAVVLTSDHEVAFVDNMFDPVVKYAPAGDMGGKYLVHSIKQRDNPKSGRRHGLLNKEQMSALLGIALGDGHVSGKSFVTGHGIAQNDYCKYKHEVLGGILRLNKNGQYSLSIANGQAQYLAEVVGKAKNKTLRNVVKHIDDIALAFMYMDDGNRNYYPEPPLLEEGTTEHSWWTNDITGENLRSATTPGPDWKRGRKWDGEYRRPTSSIATMSFSEDDNRLLAEHLKEKFGLEAQVRCSNTGHWYIHFDADNTDLLHSIVAPYVPECMEYKLNDEYRGLLKHAFSKEEVGFAATKVLSVNSIETNSDLYDIEVEGNHNFFVNDGVLVHNCISWEKVRDAVNKGIGDENPNELEKFVGDYVFNPAPGQHKISLGEPAEVLESGTGFMMIRRNTFEKFMEAYPYQSYKPDHVRSEHFDGSREIFAFFDTPIDGKRAYIGKEVAWFLEKNPKATHKEILDFVNDPNYTSVDYSKRYLSEDYMFCQWVRNMGLKIWLCPWIQLQHVGTMVYGGSLADMARIGAAATVDMSKIKKGK